jgi:cysteine desulfurase
MIYLDYNATTPVDPAVMIDMLPYFTKRFGNASSKHGHGVSVASDVETARTMIQSLIGGKNGRLVFTSGATESNNIVLTGFARAMGGNTGVRIITSSIEHKCILATSRRLLRDGNGVIILPVDKDGKVNAASLTDALKNTDKRAATIVSIMAANNEIGTIQDIKLLSQIAHHHGAFFHCDAAQMIGKLPFNVEDLDLDAMSMSAHKFYGPKGIGALWYRNRVMGLEPIIHGGGQEGGLRSGTLNVPGIIGMKSALEMAIAVMDAEIIHNMTFRNYLWQQFKTLSEVTLNGHLTDRQPGNLNVVFKYVDSQKLIEAVKDKVSISAGSACTSSSTEPSHVLKALGLSEEEINSSVRICVGRMTTANDVETAATVIIEAVNKLREESELWKMRGQI